MTCLDSTIETLDDLRAAGRWRRLQAYSNTTSGIDKKKKPRDFLFLVRHRLIWPATLNHPRRSCALALTLFIPLSLRPPGSPSLLLSPPFLVSFTFVRDFPYPHHPLPSSAAAKMHWGRAFFCAFVPVVQKPFRTQLEAATQRTDPLSVRLCVQHFYVLSCLPEFKYSIAAADFPSSHFLKGLSLFLSLCFASTLFMSFVV